MKRRYMSYLWEPSKIPRTTRNRQKRRQQENGLQAQHVNIPIILEDEERNPSNIDRGNLLRSSDSNSQYSSVVLEESSLFELERKESHHSENCCNDDCDLEGEQQAVQEPITFSSETRDKQNMHCEMPINDDFDESDTTLFQEKLCQCCAATAGDVYLLTLALGLRHNLSWTAQLDILKMVNTLYGRKVVDDTKHMYWQYVKTDNISTTTHHYCPVCESELKAENICGDNFKCTCDKEGLFKTTPYFISLSLENQIQALLKDTGFMKAILNYRFTRQKTNRDALEDIYDGAEYVKHSSEGGILSVPENFSYCFNTDGVKAGVSCSVNKTMWPIYISINELPYHERKRFVLLAGLYVGHSHPNMNTFLEPFVEQANKLSSEGITWTDMNGKEIISKIIPLCAVVDSPARCSMLGMNAHNSEYGCTFCYQRTERTQSGRRFSGGKVSELRTHNSTISDMVEAHERRSERNKKNRRYKGVWRPSVLMGLNFFDLCKGFVPDYLHALLLGAVRQHTEILLQPSTKTKFWENMEDDIGIEHLVSLIDSYLSMITPPHCITRLPRGLSQRDLWKGSEWRSWLLFYAIPCLKDELKEKYHTHFCMISVATNLLLQKSITHTDLETAEVLLIKYVFLYEEYFGAVAMNYCIHLLLHMVEGVRAMGPLWTHNAFIYEGQNRYLLQMMSSPRKLAVQLSNKYMAYFSLADFCRTLASNKGSVDFCETLTSKHVKFYVRCQETIFVGNGRLFELSDEISECLLSNNVPTENCKMFDKCLLKKVRCSTQAYSSGKKNNGSVVQAQNGKLYSLCYFIQCDRTPVLLAREIFVDPYFVPIENYELCHLVTSRNAVGNLEALKPEDIRAMCVVMDLPNAHFYGKIPFGCYGD